MTPLLSGLAFGLGAGISPGPLQTLVVTSTLERGFGAGWRVAVAPLLTDLPIIVLSVLVLSRVPSGWLDGLAIAGGVVVMLLGVWTLRSSDPAAMAGDDAGSSADLWRGATVNALSPHPWLFWITIGGTSLVAGWRETRWGALAFLAGFYVTLIGAKVVLVWLVARGRARLDVTWRRRLVVAGSVLLIGAGALIVYQGWGGAFSGEA
jgi:threonine/homoserine/homoserine lactone efflux protein